MAGRSTAQPISNSELSWTLCCLFDIASQSMTGNGSQVKKKVSSIRSWYKVMYSTTWKINAIILRIIQHSQVGGEPQNIIFHQGWEGRRLNCSLALIDIGAMFSNGKKKKVVSTLEINITFYGHSKNQWQNPNNNKTNKNLMIMSAFQSCFN